MELMSPAGNWVAFEAAIQGGCDSIYFGVEQLNMRARATMNFTVEDLPEVAQRAKAAGIKTYITLNTIVYDHDITLVKAIVDKAKEAGISAIIVSDQSAIQYAFSKGMPVHISTQLNVTNVETVKFYSLFADVMVLSRELSLKQTTAIVEAVEKEQIKGPSGELVRIEIFGHGALCVAVSGKCYMSLHTQNSSANRGACIQNCRKTYTVIDKETGHELEIDNEFIMSPKDLCTIDFMDQVMATGISVLKIEGRGRAPEYVKMVTSCYREAIDAVKDGTYSREKVAEWMSRLETVYNRGFWSGYYLGQKLGEFHDTNNSKATVKKVYIGKGNHFYPKTNIAEFKMEAQKVRQGDTILVNGTTTGVMEVKLDELFVNGVKSEEAVKGDVITFKVGDRIRPSDKLYKVVPNEELA